MAPTSPRHCEEHGPISSAGGVGVIPARTRQSIAILHESVMDCFVRPRCSEVLLLTFVARTPRNDGRGLL